MLEFSFGSSFIVSYCSAEISNFSTNRMASFTSVRLVITTALKSFANSIIWDINLGLQSFFPPLKWTYKTGFSKILIFGVILLSQIVLFFGNSGFCYIFPKSFSALFCLLLVLFGGRRLCFCFLFSRSLTWLDSN